jgi:hypothetical protein
MPTLEPVDFNPFAPGAPQGGAVLSGADAGIPRIRVTPNDNGALKLEPVDYDPFARDGADAAKDSGSMLTDALDVPASVGIGAVKGTIGLAGLPGDLTGLINAGGDKLIDFFGEQFGASPERLAQIKEGVKQGQRQTRTLAAPTSAQIRGGIESVTGPLYEPKTTVGKYAQQVGEFVPAAAAGGGGVVRNVINNAVVPGLASEYAGQKTQGTALEPWARAGTAVVTGGAASLLNRPSAPAQVIRGAMPDGINPQLFDQAQRMVDAAAQRGVRLTVPEAMEQIQPGSAKGLLGQMRVLESAPDSRATMAQVFADRPAQIEQAARSTFDTVAPRPTQPSMIGREAGEAAEGAVNNVRGAINDAAAPFYSASERTLLGAQEMARVRALPGYQEAHDAVRNNPQLARYVHGLPENSVGFLNEVKKQLDHSARNAAAPMGPQGIPNQQVAAGYTRDAAAARQAGVNASRDYETALVIEAVGRAQFLDPLMRGPLGRMAGKDTTTRNAVEALFGTESKVAGSEREIAQAMQHLAARNPRAARDLVRAHAEMTFDRAAQNLPGGANQYSGANFAKDIAGNPQDRANLAAAVRALPDGERIWQGFGQFLEIAAATGKRERPGSLTAYNAQELKDLSGGGLISGGGKAAVAPQRILTALGDAWDRWQLGRNTQELAAILTNPQASGLLRTIAARPAGSNAATIAAARLVAMANQSFKTTADK